MLRRAMFAAPLEIAADVRRMPNASAAILLNREVIGVNQDPLVKQGRRVSNDGGKSALTSSEAIISCSKTLTRVAGVNIWKKDLVDGSVAVAVYNSRNETGAETELVFETVRQALFASAVSTCK